MLKVQNQRKHKYLFDSGPQRTYVSKALADRLGLKPEAKKS